MTGRDLIKFIVRNNLFDKYVVSSNNKLVEFSDNLSNDDEISYILLDDGRERIVLRDVGETYLIKQNDFSDEMMPNLKQLDVYVSDDPRITCYNSYSESFKSWLGRVNNVGSIMSPIANYAEEDANFIRNCGTYNKMMSYLESKDVTRDILTSATVAWLQYIRECREVD